MLPDKIEPTLFQAFAKCKCQKCRVGNVFKYPVYYPTKFLIANEYCPKCGHRFEEEPGFFWAAMYISYGLSSALFVTFGFFFFYFDLPLVYLNFGALPFILLMSPLLFRYSRMILLYFISRTKFDMVLSKEIRDKESAKWN